MISSGLALDLTVCAMLVVKRDKEDEMPIEMTPQQRRKSLFGKSWSGYYVIDKDRYGVVY